MVRKTPEEVVDERHGKGLTQATLEKYTKPKEAIERFMMHIADFFYENGISFHAACSRSYEVMVESIGQIGPGVKPPSYHELRVPLFVKVVNETNKLKERHMVFLLGGKELIRPGATRVATPFLTLQSIFRHRDALKNLFMSDHWSTFKLSKTRHGQKISDTLLSSSFWSVVEDCIRASHPFLIVLRIADADERPIMPKLTMAMEVAKQSIRNSLAHKPRLLRELLDIVEGQWNRQMGVQLYGAALFFNPSKYFELKQKDNVFARRQRAMFNDVLEKMVIDEDLQALISDQVDDYDNMRGSFSKSLAIKQQKTKSPIDWWNAFGNNHVELQALTFHIVSLCSSSSGCERNWSTFQFIHSKRRNKLEHQRLNDLVYVQYNRKIASRFQLRCELGENFNHLVLEEFQWDNEWVTTVPRGARVFNSVDELFDEIFGEDHEDDGGPGSGSLRLANEERDDYLDEDYDDARSMNLENSSSDEDMGSDKNGDTTYFDDI